MEIRFTKRFPAIRVFDIVQNPNSTQGAQAHALTTRSKWRRRNYKDLYETL